MSARNFSKDICLLSFQLLLVIYSHQPALAQELNFFTELALKHSPLLNKQAYQTNFSKEKHLAQSLFTKNPVLSLSYQNIPVSSWPSFGRHVMSGINITLDQELAFPWVDVHRKDTLYQKYLSEKARLLDIKKSILLGITSLYHDLHFFYRLRSILMKNKKTLKSIINISRILVSVNKMNSSQLLKVEADIAILENQILQTRASIANVRAKMENSCGVEIKWTQGQNWLIKSKQIQIPKDFQIDDHPLYKSALLRLRSEKSQAVLEKARLFPGITLSMGYTFRKEVQNRDSGEDFISLKASMPLPFYYPLKEAHAISAQEAKSKMVSEELKQIKLALQTSWRGELVRSQNLFQAYVNFETEVLPKYQASYQASLRTLPSGTVSLLDVLDSYRKYLDVSIKQAELFRKLQLSIAKLKYLIVIPHSVHSGGIK